MNKNNEQKNNKIVIVEVYNYFKDRIIYFKHENNNYYISKTIKLYDLDEHEKINVNDVEFTQLTINNLHEYYILNKSVIDELTDFKYIKSTKTFKTYNYDRLTNNLFMFLDSRIKNFMSDEENKKYESEFYLIDNFCDIKKEKVKNFKYNKNDKYSKKYYVIYNL